MPFFRYDSKFPFIHECSEDKAQFCDIAQLKIERKRMEGVKGVCGYHVRGRQCLWGLRGMCNDSPCRIRRELRTMKCPKTLICPKQPGDSLVDFSKIPEKKMCRKCDR